MNWESHALWEVMLDVAGLLLCGCAIVFMVRWRRSENRKLAADQPLISSSDDAASIVPKALNQSAESPAPGEHRRYGGQSRGNDAPRPQFDGPPAPRKGNLPANSAYRAQASPDSTHAVGGVVASQDEAPDGMAPLTSTDPYEQVRELIDRGYSLAQIARRVSVPRGEIELMLKLKSKAYDPSQISQKDVSASR